MRSTKLCSTGCDKESYGIECKETCGQCRDLNQCYNVNGSCLTGCVAGLMENYVKHDAIAGYTALTVKKPEETVVILTNACIQTEQV